MTAAKLKKGQLVRICKSRLSHEDEFSKLPKGYSPLTRDEKLEHAVHDLSLTLLNVLSYIGGTHRSVQPEPGDLVTVVKGSIPSGPWRENFTVVACSKLGRIYYIKKEFLETISESS